MENKKSFAFICSQEFKDKFEKAINDQVMFCSVPEQQPIECEKHKSCLKCPFYEKKR